MKTLLLRVGAVLVLFFVNFMIYNVSFNFQATPYLSEEQRLEGAILMLKTTAPAYLIFSILTVWVFSYFGLKKK